MTSIIFFIQVARPILLEKKKRERERERSHGILLLMILWLLLKLDRKHFMLHLTKCHKSCPCLQPWPHLLPPPLYLTAHLRLNLSLNPDPWICQGPYFLQGWQDEEGEQFCFSVLKYLKKTHLNLVLKFHFLVLRLISNYIYVCLWYYCFLKVRTMIFLFLLTPWHLKCLLDEWINE